MSGTAAVGGSATLIATLTSAGSGSGLSGQTISFDLDGKLVGSATTNSSGVASLAGVATTDAAGTDSGGVVADVRGVRRTTFPRRPRATWSSPGIPRASAA